MHHHDGIDLVLSIDLPPRQLPRHITVFVYGAFTYVPPSLAPAMVRPQLYVWFSHLLQPQQLY